MVKVKGWFYMLAVLAFLTGCETETEICETGQPAILYYTPDCATINGYLTLGSGKRVVFKHEIEEDFRRNGIDVCVTFERVEKDIILTAECVQGEVVIITSLQSR